MQRQGTRLSSEHAPVEFFQQLQPQLLRHAPQTHDEALRASKNERALKTQGTPAIVVLLQIRVTAREDRHLGMREVQSAYILGGEQAIGRLTVCASVGAAQSDAYQGQRIVPARSSAGLGVLCARLQLPGNLHVGVRGQVQERRAATGQQTALLHLRVE